MNSTQKFRPYWHVDLKWLFGIAALLSVSAALLLHTLAAVTERETATSITSSVVAGFLNKDALNDSADLTALRQQVAMLPGDTFSPISQMPWIQISKADVMTKTPSEIRLALVRQLTDPIYDKGLNAAVQGFTTDPQQQKTFKQQASLLGLLTEKTHNTFTSLSMTAAMVAIVLIGIAIFFSAGWGRLVTPGLILLLATPVGLAIGSLLMNVPGGGNNFLSQIPADVPLRIGGIIRSSYLMVALSGASLLAVALVGKLIVLFIHRHKKATI